MLLSPFPPPPPYASSYNPTTFAPKLSNIRTYCISWRGSLYAFLIVFFPDSLIFRLTLSAGPFAFSKSISFKAGFVSPGFYKHRWTTNFSNGFFLSKGNEERESRERTLHLRLFGEYRSLMNFWIGTRGGRDRVDLNFRGNSIGVSSVI